MAFVEKIIPVGELGKNDHLFFSNPIWPINPCFKTSHRPMNVIAAPGEI